MKRLLPIFLGTGNKITFVRISRIFGYGSAKCFFVVSGVINPMFIAIAAAEGVESETVGTSATIAENDRRENVYRCLLVTKKKKQIKLTNIYIYIDKGKIF